jgi:hypothetical protein
MASFYRRFTCLSAKPAGGSAVDGPILVSDHLHSMEPCQQFRVAIFRLFKDALQAVSEAVPNEMETF